LNSRMASSQFHSSKMPFFFQSKKSVAIGKSKMRAFFEQCLFKRFKIRREARVPDSSFLFLLCAGSM
jgi:hypothetical protein